MKSFGFDKLVYFDQKKKKVVTKFYFRGLWRKREVSAQSRSVIKFSDCGDRDILTLARIRMGILKSIMSFDHSETHQ